MNVFHENQVPWPMDKAKATERKNGQFKVSGVNAAAERIEKAVSAFTANGKKWRTRELWIYADAELGARAKFLNNQRNGRDPGVVVTFDIDGHEYKIATDRFSDAAQNLCGIAAYIESVRAQERYGIFDVGDMLGFAALPSPSTTIGVHWSSFLGVKADATVDEIKAAFRQLSLKMHPDNGGNPQEFQRLVAARDMALQESQQ